MMSSPAAASTAPHTPSEHVCALLRLLRCDDIRKLLLTGDSLGILMLWRAQRVCAEFRNWCRDALDMESRLHLAVRLVERMNQRDVLKNRRREMMSDGETVTVPFQVTDSAGDLKVKICSSWGIPPEQQKLICAGGTLKDNQTLSDHNVHCGSTLYVLVQRKIIIRLWPVPSVTFDLPFQATILVGALKTKLQEIGGIPAERQRLFYPPVTTTHGELEDERTLAEYGICAWAELQLVKHTPRNVFYVRCFMTGATTTLPFQTAQSIAAVKASIRSKMDLSMEFKLRLVYKSVELEDSRTMGNYGIELEETVHLIAVRIHVKVPPTQAQLEALQKAREAKAAKAAQRQARKRQRRHGL